MTQRQQEGRVHTLGITTSKSSGIEEGGGNKTPCIYQPQLNLNCQSSAPEEGGGVTLMEKTPRKDYFYSSLPEKTMPPPPPQSNR